MNINQYIDHTNLKPYASANDIEVLVADAIQHQFAAVCIPPYYIDLGKKMLKDSDVKLCSVIGFPFGYDHVATKMEAISRAVNAGADELDVVINIPAVKNADWDVVRSEIDNYVTATKLKAGKTLKLILETAYLSKQELEHLCNLCVEFGVDFAKTSTGHANHGATVEHVAMMKAVLGDKVKIKASGGIKDRKFAQALIDAGANRLGTSAGLTIIKSK